MAPRVISRMTPPRMRHRAGGALAGFVFVVCALLAPQLFAQNNTNGRVAIAFGTVTAEAPGEAQRQLAKDDNVVVGSTVKTGANSRAVIVMTRQSVIRLGQNSEAVIEVLDDAAAQPRVLIDLKAGSIGTMIQQQAGRQMDFKIKTPTGTAAARGTTFAVAVEDGKGFVKVEEGQVEIKPANAAAEPAESGRVAVAIGDVKEAPPNGAERALKKGDTVQVGSLITTGDRSRAVVTMTKRSAIRISANSETLIEAMDDSDTAPKVLIDLKKGTMGALINPDERQKMDFKITTPSGVAAARGTFFSVAVEGDRGYVLTKEGRVSITPNAPPQQ